MKKETVQVVKMDSDTRKIEKLKQKVSKPEHIVGQKQIQQDYQDKLIEIAGEEFGIDLIKNLVPEPGMVLGAPGKTPMENEPFVRLCQDMQA